LGAHVDHQGGLVTGMTVDRRVSLAAVPTNEPSIAVTSLDFPGEVSVALEDFRFQGTGEWGDYVRAAVSVLMANHDLRRGFRAVLRGELPGAGLSSSAAVLVAHLVALARVNEIDLPREEVAALVQRAENTLIGVASGLLDPSTILFAEKGALTLVDCADHRVEQVRGPEYAADFRVLVAYSGISRDLAGSGFNARVEECREAARMLLELSGGSMPAQPKLSDVRPEIFERWKVELPRPQRRRATHYFSEQRRVLAGIESWKEGDLARFGALVNASGASSIHNYDCGTGELITLYELLREAPGVFGARFSGGGFGGCCIALVDPDAGQAVIESVSRGYRTAHPEAATNASFHLCRTEGPCRVLDLES